MSRPRKLTPGERHNQAYDALLDLVTAVVGLAPMDVSGQQLKLYADTIAIIQRGQRLSQGLEEGTADGTPADEQALHNLTKAMWAAAKAIEDSEGYAVSQGDRGIPDPASFAGEDMPRKPLD